MKLAVVLDERERHPTSAEMLEYVIANPDPKAETDQGLRDALLNLVYRDGMPFESIGYNYGWVGSASEIAEVLLGGGTDFFTEPRLQKLLNWMFDMTGSPASSCRLWGTRATCTPRRIHQPGHRRPLSPGSP